MRMTARRFVLTAVALAATTFSALPAALATEAPDPGDPRATARSGNLAWDHRDSCRTAGLTGTAYEKGLTSTQTATHLTITGFNGYEVTGVVVKGGNAYNVYPVDKLGELPWADLHSPLLANKNAGVPAISHWFFCATKSTTTTTTTTTTVATTTPTQSTTDATTPTTTAPTTTAETTGASTTGESAAESTTTTTTPVAAASPSDDDLANTGFGSLWLLFAGLGLVAAGALAVASPKLRALLRR
ncbi:hypothetical protein GCM10010185_15100 [Saccharothrix coeruleofusca]|uniref:LPXTG-motif cell wall-anchored protein n=2 Tax=Saccharothrix coeruleofusca TaxID=33919 RepID=A0A918ED12_9PSEU|nr:hypothetical protein GCM10010185_15100 [Saccharothrix coeruleofusca]